MADQGVTRERIANARILIDQARFLVLNAAQMMDTVGNKGAKKEIAMIKVAAPAMACQVIDWAMQVHGGAGVSEDFPLAAAYAQGRWPSFASYDLTSFQMKFCTSAPFAAALKADVLARWPGTLVEFYGMTEGGGTCILEAHLHATKLHTVGQPAEGHDIRLIDDAGHEAAAGEAGEVVGHSAGMMTGYHGQPEMTREAEWFAPDGKRFIRTGDIGRFDADGFLTLFDRKKDMKCDRQGAQARAARKVRQAARLRCAGSPSTPSTPAASESS